MIKELQETVNEQAVRLSNNEAIVSDLKRQCDEWKNCRLSQNFSELRDVPNGKCSLFLGLFLVPVLMESIGINITSVRRQKPCSPV